MIREREKSQRHLEKSRAERKSGVNMARDREAGIAEKSAGENTDTKHTWAWGRENPAVVYRTQRYGEEGCL